MTPLGRFSMVDMLISPQGWKEQFRYQKVGVGEFSEDVKYVSFAIGTILLVEQWRLKIRPRRA